MKNFSMEVDGAEEMQKNLEKLGEKYGKDVVKAARKGAELVRGAAVKSIQAVSDGQNVTRSREGGNTYRHIASKPGDAPNTDTGRLASSVQVEVKLDGIYVGSTVEYADELEYGTKGMAARPWLNPALESQRRKIEKLMADAVQEDVQL